MTISKKITVLHLISSTSFLGAERVVCELALGTDSSLFITTVGLMGSSTDNEKRFRDEIVGSDVTVVNFPCKTRFSITCLKKIAQYVDDNNIDIVHTHGYKSDIYAYLVKLFWSGKNRLIATNHTWKLGTFWESVYKTLDIMCLKSFAKIAAVSKEVLSEMVHIGIPTHRIRLVNNGISIKEHGSVNRFELRKQFGIGEDDFVIGCVASLTTEKAHADLIRAFALLKESVHNTKLVLVGDGPLRAELEKMTTDLNLNDAVAFTGQRSDVSVLLRTFDIFALVSYSEGLPMAMLEAMAASLPLVVSAVGAIPDVISPLKNGILVAPGDVEGIGNAFKLLVQQPQLGENMGQLACEDVIANYSVQRMATDYESLYLEILGIDSAASTPNEQ